MRSRMRKRRLSKRGAHSSLSNTARHTQPRNPLPTPPVSQVATTATACNGGYPVDEHDGQYPEAHSCRKESGASQRDARDAPHRQRRSCIGANESDSCVRKIEEGQIQEGQNAEEQEVQVEVQVKGGREGQKREEGEEGEEGEEEEIVRGTLHTDTTKTNGAHVFYCHLIFVLREVLPRIHLRPRPAPRPAAQLSRHYYSPR